MHWANYRNLVGAGSSHAHGPAHAAPRRAHSRRSCIPAASAASQLACVLRRSFVHLQMCRVATANAVTGGGSRRRQNTACNAANGHRCHTLQSSHQLQCAPRCCGVMYTLYSF